MANPVDLEQPLGRRANFSFEQIDRSSGGDKKQ